ncbi:MULTISPECIES: hypothetical protein [Vibrio]|uniref:Uncharacterized protein n=1 Tax=Vibrio aquimaris TaxID=2587862 RepID=A0A5P9CRZ4_9VIBR|nr:MULTISPECIES: hypothetical protein [Vibrio]QFT28452.1 hypothetical protein FIV01_18820 [Vibrio aquimaris]
MNLHTCTIVLTNNHKLTYHNVEKSLEMIEEHGTSGISNILIDAVDGKTIRSYYHLSVEESIESLMDL